MLSTLLVQIYDISFDILGIPHGNGRRRCTSAKSLYSDRALLVSPCLLALRITAVCKIIGVFGRILGLSSTFKDFRKFSVTDIGVL